MIRVGLAKGARAETFRGYPASRPGAYLQQRPISHYALGLALGRGQVPGEALAGRRSVVEGVATATAVSELAKRLGIEMRSARLLRRFSGAARRLTR